VAVDRRRLILIGTVAAAALALAACDKAGRSDGMGDFRSIDITGADYARELLLPDADGKPRTLAEFKGKVTVVFFGFTHCPDVCPTTMVELAAVKKALGADGARVQPIFVTIDPERDTPQLLKAYVENFGPDFLALRGTPEQTKAAAKHFKIFYAKVPGKTPDSYTMDHTAGSYVFDTEGRVRLFTRYGLGTEALQADLKRLLAPAG
jgi:protein SCO1/2